MRDIVSYADESQQRDSMVCEMILIVFLRDVYSKADERQQWILMV